MSKTKIEWSQEVWNPIRGCSKVSEGCRHCYAERTAARFADGPNGPFMNVINAKGLWNGKLEFVPHKLLEPLSKREPTTYFVNSMSDLFHENVPDEWLDKIFAVMCDAPRHTFQVLTKRPERMQRYLNNEKARRTHIAGWLKGNHIQNAADGGASVYLQTWPLPNVCLGTSVENQDAADERIDDLVRCPAAVRFLSCEPLLGEVNLGPWMCEKTPFGFEYLSRHYDRNGNFDKTGSQPAQKFKLLDPPLLHWVICGGESCRPATNARPMNPNWARLLRDQCVAANVPFFFKQWGEWIDEAQIGDGLDPQRVKNLESTTFISTGSEGDVQMLCVGKKRAGRLLDGMEWNEMPKVVRGEK